MESEFAELGDDQPELLDHHYTSADDADHAVACRAACCFAIRLCRGRTTLPNCAGVAAGLAPFVRAWRARIETADNLGSVLMSTQGFAAPSVGKVYAQAHKLSQEVGEISDKFADTCGGIGYSIINLEHSCGLKILQPKMTQAECPQQLIQVLKVSCHRFVRQALILSGGDCRYLCEYR